MPPDPGRRNKTGQLPEEESFRERWREGNNLCWHLGSDWRSFWRRKACEVILAHSCSVSNPRPLVSICFHSVSVDVSCGVIIIDWWLWVVWDVSVQRSGLKADLRRHGKEAERGRRSGGKFLSRLRSVPSQVNADASLVQTLKAVTRFCGFRWWRHTAKTSRTNTR